MKKFTFSVIGFAFLVCAFSANAAALGEPCIVDVDCDDSVYCNGIESCSSEGSICIAGTDVDCVDGYCDELSQSCVDCLSDADCDDGVYCDGAEICDAGACIEGASVDCGDGYCVEDLKGCVECLEDLDCVDNAAPFCSDSLECVECLADLDCLDNETPFCGDMLECVECLEDIDCAEGQLCDLGVCADEAACGLFIKPPILNLKKGVKPLKQMFTIKGIQGEEGFDPASEEIDFGPCEIVESFVAGGSDVLKVRIIVPDNATFEGEFLDVQVGSCTGQIFLKMPENEAAFKEQKRLEKQEHKELEKEEKEVEKEIEKETKELEKEEKEVEKEIEKEVRDLEKEEKEVEKEIEKEEKKLEKESEKEEKKNKGPKK